MSKKTVSIPNNIGTNLISETLGKISFSPEVKDLLSALNAEIVVKYSPNAQTPTIEISTRTGRRVCDFEEFVKLSGYRRFVAEAMKDAEKSEASGKKLKIVSYFIRLMKLKKDFEVPERILEQNYTKFNQLGASMDVVEEHLDVINDTVNNKWRTYLVEKHTRIMKILRTMQARCMGVNPLDKDQIDTDLFAAGVPKWLYNKLLDKAYTSNLKNDCITLLFPKNNYFKSISMSTKELASNDFRLLNQDVLVNSGGIIALSQFNFGELLPDVPLALDEQFEAAMLKYQWVLTNPYSADEILTLRETGKMPPVFKELQPQSRSGKNQRPESELARHIRQASNTLGRIQSTWNGILNFVVPTEDPKIDFWSLLYPNSVWDITPTSSIYNCIRAETKCLEPLKALRAASSKEILQRIASIAATVARIPRGSDHYGIFGTAFVSLLEKQELKQKKITSDPTMADYTIGDVGLAIEANPPTPEEIEAGKTFLGQKKKKEKDSKYKRGAASVRLNSRVLKELKPLEKHSAYPSILKWLSTSFKNGDYIALQEVAARRILGEALSYQDTIFANQDVMNLIRQIEEEEESDFE